MPRFRSGDPWRALWQAATSDYVLGAALLALALALVLAAWLPQMPAGGAGKADWDAEVFRRFGGRNWPDAMRSALQAVGAFRVADTVGLRSLLAFLAFCLLARLFDSADGLWRGWRDVASPCDAPWTRVTGDWDELVASLRRQRFRIAVKGEQADAARADRWPWGELGPVLVYLGGLVVLAGMASTALWGWRVGPLVVAAGESVSLGHGSDLVLQLEELTQDGRRGVGKVWREGKTLISAGDLAVGRPLTGGGVGAYVVGSGAGLRLQARLNDTQILKLPTVSDQEGQEELVLTFTEDDARRVVSVPEVDLVLLLTMPQPVQGGRLPGVQAFELSSGQSILEQDAPADATWTIGDVSFVSTPVPCVQIQVVHDPGAFWRQLGVLGLLVGARLWGLWPPRRLWLRRLAGDIEVVGDVQGSGLDAQVEG